MCDTTQWSEATALALIVQRHVAPGGLEAEKILCQSRLPIGLCRTLTWSPQTRRDMVVLGDYQFERSTNRVLINR